MNILFRDGKNKMNMDDEIKSGKFRAMRIFAARLTELVQEAMDQGTEESTLCREIGVHIRLIGQWKDRGTITKDERKLWLLYAGTPESPLQLHHRTP